MKIDEIIEDLCNHTITKHQAIELIKEKNKQEGYVFQIESISKSSVNGHYHINAVMRYGEGVCDKKFNKNDSITIIPEF